MITHYLNDQCQTLHYELLFFFPSINSKNSSAISINFFLSDKNSSVYPWIFNADSETFLSGFR